MTKHFKGSLKAFSHLIEQALRGSGDMAGISWILRSRILRALRWQMLADGLAAASPDELLAWADMAIEEIVSDEEIAVSVRISFVQHFLSELTKLITGNFEDAAD